MALRYRLFELVTRLPIQTMVPCFNHETLTQCTSLFHPFWPDDDDWLRCLFHKIRLFCWFSTSQSNVLHWTVSDHFHNTKRFDNTVHFNILENVIFSIIIHPPVKCRLMRCTLVIEILNFLTYFSTKYFLRMQVYTACYTWCMMHCILVYYTHT